MEIDPSAPKRVKFIAYVPRRFDDDGLQAALKPCRDGMQESAPAVIRGGRTVRAAQVGCGIIHSDGIKSGHQFEYRQETTRDRGRGGVFVIVEWVKVEGSPS
jgi:hypothetical protein